MLNMQSLSYLVLDPRSSRRRVIVGPVRGAEKAPTRGGGGVAFSVLPKTDPGIYFHQQESTQGGSRMVLL